LLHGLDHYRFIPVAPHGLPLLAVHRIITVSVLLCNYNHACIFRSLSAICTRSRLPEEVIVLDDGSDRQ
jgi:hypothetical protein